MVKKSNCHGTSQMLVSKITQQGFKKINGIPLIEILYSRLSASKKIDEVVIATTKLKSDKKLVNYLSKKILNFLW